MREALVMLGFRWDPDGWWTLWIGHRSVECWNPSGQWVASLRDSGNDETMRFECPSPGWLARFVGLIREAA